MANPDVSISIWLNYTVPEASVVWVSGGENILTYGVDRVVVEYTRPSEEDKDGLDPEDVEDEYFDIDLYGWVLTAKGVHDKRHKVRECASHALLPRERAAFVRDVLHIDFEADARARVA